MKQKSVGLTLRAVILALVLSLVAGTPALPPLDGVAYAQSSGSGLTATLAPDNSSVNLTWDAVTGADSYEIWRGPVVNNNAQWGTSAYATVDAPTVTYTDSSVTAGTTYAYAVRSVTGGTPAGWTGPYPNVAIPGGTQAPTAAPTVSVAPAGHTAVNVSWTSVSGATGYQVQFWHAGLDDWELISGNQTSPYPHTGLTAGTEYYYVVRAVNAGGMGPWSSWRTDNSRITLQATTAVPELSLVHVSRNVVQLNWTPTTGAVNYDLERERVVTGTNATTVAFARLPTGLVSGTTYTDSDADFGIATPADDDVVMYRYRVQAIDSGGVRGTWSNIESVTIPATSNRLSAPTLPTPSAVAQDHANISFTWMGVAGATYYQVQWKTGAGSYSSPIRVEPLADPASNVTYNHSGLNPSTSYTYQVRAVNINGPSDWSAEASATTRATPSASGQMPKVTGLRVTDASDSDGLKVKLTWGAVSGATHYDIMRFNPGATTPAWAAPPDGNMLTTGRISTDDAKSPPTWTDADITAVTGLEPGRTYYYVVSAVNDGPDDTAATDDDMGEWSDYMSVTLKDLVPGTPTDLTATTTGQRSVWVSWTEPGHRASETPVAEAGIPTSYTLEWRLLGQNAAWNPMTVTGTTFNHTGRQPNTEYHYRVRAHNSGGMSAWSDEASTTTLPSVLGPPSGLTAVDATDGTNARIAVSWTSVTGATGYEIQRFGAGPSNNMWSDLGGTVPTDTTPSPVTMVSGTMVTDDNDNDPATANTGTNLAEDTTYYYRMRTVTGEVKSQWSTVFSGKTRHAMPGAPTLVAASTGESMIRLSWGAVAGATNYKLEFLEGMHAAATFENDLITRGEVTVSGNDRHYVHMNLKAGTLYSYRLTAILPQNVESTPSTVREEYTKPARPASLSARAAISTTMVLTWDPVSFVATDGTAGTLTTATDYQVERRVAGSGDWAPASGTVDCTTTAGTCTLSDAGTDLTPAGLSANTHYYFRVRATVTRTPTGGASTVYRSYWSYTNQRTPQ